MYRHILNRSVFRNYFFEINFFQFKKIQLYVLLTICYLYFKAWSIACRKVTFLFIAASAILWYFWKKNNSAFSFWIVKIILTCKKNIRVLLVKVLNFYKILHFLFHEFSKFLVWKIFILLLSFFFLKFENYFST